MHLALSEEACEADLPNSRTVIQVSFHAVHQMWGAATSCTARLRVLSSLADMLYCL